MIVFSRGWRWARPGGLDSQRHNIRWADFDTLAVEIAFVQISQINQRFAVDHFQNALIAMGNANFAADAVAHVDSQGCLQHLLAARIFLGEFADGAGRFAVGGVFEFRFEAIEGGL